jgi:hypothetical protein
MTNDQRMSNAQVPMAEAERTSVEHWSLGFGYSLVIGHWLLVIVFFLEWPTPRECAAGMRI